MLARTAASAIAYSVAWYRGGNPIVYELDVSRCKLVSDPEFKEGIAYVATDCGCVRPKRKKGVASEKIGVFRGRFAMQLQPGGPDPWRMRK